MEKLNFAALGEHCRVRGTTNPGGMFWRLLEKKRWHFITEGDEEAVRVKLKAFLYDEPELAEARFGQYSEDLEGGESYV